MQNQFHCLWMSAAAFIVTGVILSPKCSEWCLGLKGTVRLQGLFESDQSHVENNHFLPKYWDTPVEPARLEFAVFFIFGVRLGSC